LVVLDSCFRRRAQPLLRAHDRTTIKQWLAR
jgi:hypothetical protein